MLYKCADVLEARDVEIVLADLALDHAQQSLVESNIAVAEQAEQLDAWYRQPVVLGGMGFSLGGLITVFVLK